jgi:ABC-type Zn2+ transport system substrate-binding protein/surface adhesin
MVHTRRSENNSSQQLSSCTLFEAESLVHSLPGCLAAKLLQILLPLPHCKSARTADTRTATHTHTYTHTHTTHTHHTHHTHTHTPHTHTHTHTPHTPHTHHTHTHTHTHTTHTHNKKETPDTIAALLTMPSESKTSASFPSSASVV